MDVITKEEFSVEYDIFAKKIRDGKLFIHPTDTIYGIGCDATNSEAVKAVRALKQRYTTPFSIIAPSEQWIYDNCEVLPEAQSWIDKLPGPYTLVFRLKNKHAIAKEVNNNIDTIGVRIPDSWFSEQVSRLGFPIITTSANISGEPFMTTLDNLNPAIKSNVEFIIYEEEKSGRPSTVINLSGPHVLVVKR